MQGNFRQRRLPDVLDDVVTPESTGVLTVLFGQEESRLFFRRGRLVGCSPLAAAPTPPDAPIDQRVKEDLFLLCHRSGAEEGEYRFEPGFFLPPQPTTALQWDQALKLAFAHRDDIWRNVAPWALPTGRAYPLAHDIPTKADAEATRRLLELADGSLTIEETLRQGLMTPDAFWEALEVLTNAKRLQRATEDDYIDLVAEALQRNEKERARALLQAVLTINPNNSAAQSALQSIPALNPGAATKAAFILRMHYKASGPKGTSKREQTLFDYSHANLKRLGRAEVHVVCFDPTSRAKFNTRALKDIYCTYPNSTVRIPEGQDPRAALGDVIQRLASRGTAVADATVSITLLHNVVVERAWRIDLANPNPEPITLPGPQTTLTVPLGHLQSGREYGVLLKLSAVSLKDKDRPFGTAVIRAKSTPECVYSMARQPPEPGSLVDRLSTLCDAGARRSAWLARLHNMAGTRSFPSAEAALAAARDAKAGKKVPKLQNVSACVEIARIIDNLDAIPQRPWNHEVDLDRAHASRATTLQMETPKIESLPRPPAQVGTLGSAVITVDCESDSELTRYAAGYALLRIGATLPDESAKSDHGRDVVIVADVSASMNDCVGCSGKVSCSCERGSKFDAAAAALQIAIKDVPSKHRLFLCAYAGPADSSSYERLPMNEPIESHWKLEDGVFPVREVPPGGNITTWLAEVTTWRMKHAGPTFIGPACRVVAEQVTAKAKGVADSSAPLTVIILTDGLFNDIPTDPGQFGEGP